MFKFLIEGRTIKELKENIVEFFNEFESLQPGMEGEGEQEDFLTQAAANPFQAPSIPANAAEPSAMVPTIPAIPATIPESPQPSPASIGSSNSVDSAGMPWDARIHASSRATTKDGTWRYKRGVEDPQIRQVEHELIAKAKGMQAAEMQPAPAIPQAPPVALPPIPASPLAAVPPLQPVAPVIPLPPPVQVLPNAHTAETFAKNLVPVLAKLAKEGKITAEYINSLKAHYGVDEIHKVSPEQAVEMFHMFVEYGMIASV